MSAIQTPPSSYRLPRSGSSDSLRSSVTMAVPDGVPFRDWLNGWTDCEVGDWLAENKCHTHARLFAEHDIRGDVLLDVDQQALKEMGIQSVGERIKIVVAIKKLRAACVAARHAEDLRDSKRDKAAPRIPPPLHLDSSASHHPALAGSRGTSHPHSLALPPLTSSTTSLSPSSPAGSLLRRAPSPNRPLQTPAPKTGLPLPPAQSPPERPRTSASIPSHEARSKSKPAWNSSVPGISLSKLSNSPSSSSSVSSSSYSSAGHRKTPSSSSLSGRPHTAAAGSSYGYQLPHHPYASSPAMEPARPHTANPASAKSNGAGLTPINENYSPTSPAFPNSDHPRTLGSTLPASLLHDKKAKDNNNSNNNKEAGGYSVGKGGFSRPTTTAGTVSATADGLVQTPPTLEELRRRAIKFSDETGESRMVHFEGSPSINELLTRVLKKFNKYQVGKRSEPDLAEMDGWLVYAMNSDGSARLLNELDFHSICCNLHRPERGRGLMLRRPQPNQNHTKPRSKLRNFFGEELPPTDTRGTSGLISPTSPTYMLDVHVPSTQIEPASPTPSSPASALEHHHHHRDRERTQSQPQRTRKMLNRASVISVLSGFGDIPPPMPGQTDAAPPTRSRFRSFFGHRPPSEMISNHLADYFPSAEKKLLNKTARQSIRRSLARGSTWEANPNRFSVSSTGSAGTMLSVELPPPLPGKGREHYAPLPINQRPLSRSPEPDHSPADPDDSMSTTASSPTAEDDDESSLLKKRPKSSMSMGSHLSVTSRSSSQRGGRDSDTASLMTIDEITAEVEHRRRSTIVAHRESRVGSDGLGAGEDDEDDGEQEFNGRKASVELPDAEQEESEDEEESEEEEDEEEEAEQDASPEKVTSTGTRNQIKWIKGALIGAGSFGQVFLAMNAMTGTLMAVKQVELPTGESHNETRRKGMLEALEREIELLKGLQHPNIVEYLDSSTDGTHLNIFLEYVPGGSVVALLRNYGSFEEPLVRNFVRQILQGLNYLHEREIIHRDIKGANILVDNKGSIKISDFGISKKLDDNMLSGARTHRPSLQGSVFWMAPEVVKQTSYTSKADIWSLGCVTIEMLTGDHPHVNLNQMQALFKIGTNSAAPEIPTDVSGDAQRFLEMTFHQDYKARPSAAELLQTPFILDSASQQTPTAAAFQI